MRHAAQQNLSNAVCGVLDYATWPIGMLAVAPVLLRHLGIPRFGVWAVAMAAINAGAILASGFGDANIQQVAIHRGQRNLGALIQTVRNAMAIHLVLGSALGALAWVLAPALAARVVPSDAALRADCLGALRIGAFIVLARAVETVCISTQRAVERYGPAVYLSVAGRIAAVLLAAALAWCNYSITDILFANAVVMALSLALQIRNLRALLQAESLLPTVNRECLRALLAFGVFSWIQAASSIVIGQADRLFTGAAMGAPTLAAYALCVQVTQPLYGIASSGLHFLFPHLAARMAAPDPGTVRRTISRALLANTMMIAAGGLLLVVGGRSLLALLGGPQIARTAGSFLLPAVAGTALLALSVTPYYVLLAMGRIRLVAAINVLASAIMLLCLAKLMPIRGVEGVVLARLLYGSITLLMCIPLLRYLLTSTETRTPSFLCQAEYAVVPAQTSGPVGHNRSLRHGRL